MSEDKRRKLKIVVQSRCDEDVELLRVAVGDAACCSTPCVSKPHT